MPGDYSLADAAGAAVTFEPMEPTWQVARGKVVIRPDAEGETEVGGILIKTAPGDVTGLGTLVATYRPSPLDRMNWPVGMRVVFRPFSGFVVETPEWGKVLILDQDDVVAWQAVDSSSAEV